jgi:hypothetical protein
MTQSKLEEYCDQQAIVASAISENIIDHGPGDVGQGAPLQLVVWVTEDFTDLTDLTVQLETHTAADFGSERTVLQLTDGVPLADLVEGYEFRFSSLPVGMLRYSILRFIVNGTNPTAGKISGRLALDRQADNPNL